MSASPEDLYRQYKEIEKEAKTYHALDYYEPYPFQKAFHNAKAGIHYVRPFEVTPGPLADVKAMITGNQIGKTLAGAKEVAYHATGIYPGWWEGWRFSEPPQIMVCGVTNDKTRDLLQRELCGDPLDEHTLGTGSIPKDAILETVRKPGVPNAFDSLLVKHPKGKSKIMFQSYEAKIGSFMGLRLDLIWGDEQMPEEVYFQFLRACISTHGKIMLTFTPENGETDTVYQLLHDLKRNQSVVRAGWDDADHISKDPRRMESLAEQWPAWQIPLRRDGEPLMGTGRVFSIPETRVSYEVGKDGPSSIPPEWRKGVGIDWGLDHPFAAVFGGYSEDTDTIWIYDCFRKKDGEIPLLASDIKKRGEIPVFWPHDMNKRMPGNAKAGTTLMKAFKDEGCWMFSQFTNPPGPQQREGQGGIAIEPGIREMEQRFQSGRLRVAGHLVDWFEEYRNYHHKDGQIVFKRDDLMSATRYLTQMLRMFRSGKMSSGALEYRNRGIV